MALDETEVTEFVALLRDKTSLSRIGYDELVAALTVAQDAGFVVGKPSKPEAPPAVPLKAAAHGGNADEEKPTKTKGRW